MYSIVSLVSKKKTASYIATPIKQKKVVKEALLGGESNPGLLCDRQGYSPLYYQGSAYQNEIITASVSIG